MGLRSVIGRLRLSAAVESCTLCALVAAWGWRVFAEGPDLAGALGPIHGIAFLVYAAAVFHGRETFGWAAPTTVWLLAGALVPFAGLVLAERLSGEDVRPLSRR